MSLAQLLNPANQNSGWTNYYANTLNCNNLNIAGGGTGSTGSASATFPSIRLTDTNFQILCGPTGATNTIINANIPSGSSQTVSVPDSGVSSTTFILRDTPGPQTIASELTLVGQTYPLAMANSIADNLNYIQVVSPAAARVIKLPDSGVAGATGTNFILKDISGGTQTINTNTAFPNGINFGAASLSTVLSEYINGQISPVTLTGIWATTHTTTIYYERLGQRVTLFFTPTLFNATTSSIILSSGFTMPVALQPTQGGVASNAQFSIIVNDNNSAEFGTFAVLSDGSLRITANNAAGVSGNFSGSASSGTSGFVEFAVTYLLT